MKFRLFTLGVLTAAAMPALGQEQDSAAAEAQFQLEEIIVQARRRAEALTDSPVAISAVTGDALEQRGIQQLQAIAQTVPNLVIGGAHTADAIYVRGIGTSPNNPGFEQSVSLFMDGLYYGNGRWLQQAYVDVDTVQVMRGPQGVFFGKNTIAGAIDIATRNPTDTFEGSIRAGYEFEAKERYVQGVLSGPLADGLSARLVVRAAKMAGWMDNAVTGEESPDSNEQLVRLGLKWEPNDDLRVVVKGQYGEYEDDGGPNNTAQLIHCGNGTPSVLANFNLPAVDDCKANGTNYAFGSFLGDHYTKYKSYSISSNIDWRVGQGSLKAITGLTHFNYRSLGDSDISSADAIQAFSNQKATAFSQEIRYLTEFEGPFNVLVGGYYQTTDMKYFNSGRIFPLPTATWRRNTSQDGKSWAAFAELTYSPVSQLEISVGGRYTEERKDSEAGNSFYALPAFNAPALSDRFKDEDFSPSITATWKPHTDVMVYAAFKEGFKAGGYSHGSTLTAASRIEGLTFGSERVSGYEAGVKTYLLDRRAQLSLVAYDYKYKDLQVNSYNPVLATFTVNNAGKARTRGAELEGQLRLTQRLEFDGSLTYNKAEFTEFVGPCYVGQTAALGCDVPLGSGFGRDFDGRPTPLAPEWTARMGVKYSTQVGGLDLTLSGDAQYSGGYFGDIVENPNAYQDSYIRYNASVTLSKPGKGWRAALIGRNLTNETVLVYTYERPLAGRDIVGYIERLRQVSLELSYDF